ncbi:MAG: acetolactate synthase-1/2/3 large subunit, partial [Candidatus Omnitrophota bacterium]
DDMRFPLIPQYVVSEMRKIVPEDGILSLDNGMYKIWFARNYRAYERNTILLDNALATMGAGLPAAIAAKIVEPTKKVVAICGDGGFMMNSQELETAVRLGIDLVVIIINDDAFGMIKWKQAEAGFVNFGMDMQNPDFVKYAQSYGAHGHRVESAEHFPKLFQECLDAKGIHVIDVPVDYSENKRVLIDELRAKSCEL